MSVGLGESVSKRFFKVKGNWKQEAQATGGRRVVSDSHPPSLL